jgi:hypothetical protein
MRRDAAGWSLRFARNVVLWLIPAWLAWLLVSPFYDRFLAAAGQNLLHATESPNATRLLVDGLDIVITRSDFPPARANVAGLRATDLHFDLILLAALFLAVPGVAWRERLANLGWALLIAVLFHLLLLFLWVKSVYANQLGDWSAAHYGALARNVYGLGKHMLDLGFKFALPLLLWSAFYLRRLLPPTED